MTYTSVAKWLHWLVAGAIVLQFVLAKLAEFAAADTALMQQLALLAHHKSVGITILALAVCRLLWRISHKPPPLPENMVAWQKTASSISHWSLYVLLFALPVSGWTMSSASAYSVSWFNLVPLPDLVAPNESLKETLMLWHEGMAKALLVIASLHIIAALKHAIIDKDTVLARISSTSSVGVFVCVIALGLYFLPPTNNDNDTTTQQVNQAVAPVSHARIAPSVSSLPAWNIDYENSHITFAAEQAGAPFTGQWMNWSAAVKFDPKHLDESQAIVTVDISSVSTQDTDRDGTLLGDDFFAANLFPNAEFATDTIAASEVEFSIDDEMVARQGFAASGTLTIKSVQHPITLDFVVDPVGPASNGKLILLGAVRLDRLALGLGLGDWQDPSWVGQFVDVTVKVVATIDATP